jgi:hypothetical protein
MDIKGNLHEWEAYENGHKNIGKNSRYWGYIPA